MSRCHDYFFTDIADIICDMRESVIIFHLIFFTTNFSFHIHLFVFFFLKIQKKEEKKNEENATFGMICCRDDAMLTMVIS